VLRELSAPKKVVAAAGGWDGSRAIRTAATFLAFCFLWSLWSTESVSQWLWTLTLVGNVDTKGVVLITGVVTIVAALGGRDWKSWSPASTWAPVALRPATRTTLTLLMLVVLGLPAFRNAPPMLADLMAAVHASGLNARDTATQHRGYYEQLDVRSAPVALAANVAARSEGWTEIVDLGIVRDRKDLLLLDLEPSRSVDWNGKPFSTNRWGMRDQDYGESKGPGIYRIALLGPSHVMGDNVPDGQTFEALVERRLNAELTSGGTCHFEVLNFAMPGYSVLQDLAILEDRVFAFAPDMVLITRHTSERALIERSLERLLRYDVAVPHDALAALLRDAGLDALHRGSVPVPSALGRSLARSLGLDVRMPDSELAARVRRMSDEAAIWAYRSIAEQTRAHGAVPAILALNVVSAPTAADFPDGASLDPLQLPEVNLFDVYPVDRLQELQVAPWDDHPNQEGHRLIAERLYPELTALLQSVSTSPSIPRERRVAPCPTSTTR
jgi:hypothetical protein